MQSLSNLLGQVKAQHIKEKEPANKEPAKELTFHQRQSAAYQADPENCAYRQAATMGKLKADIFMNSVRDASSHAHEQNFSFFKNTYDMDPAKAEADFIRQECDAADAHPYEFWNASYEQALMRKYRPQGEVTKEQVAFYDNFCKAMREKWDKVGYKGDAAFVDQYVSKYGLKAAPNGLQDFKEKL